MIFVLLIFLISCDFTPPLNKEVLKAQNFISHQNYEKASVEYLSILKKKPPTDLQIKINYQLGDLFSIYLGQYYKAVDHYSRVLNISDDPLWQVKAQERLGELYFSFIKNFLRSSSIYSKLSSFKPVLTNQHFYLFRYALSEFYQGNLTHADKLFEDIEKDKKNEHSKRALYYRALTSFEKKEWETTVKHLEKYIRVETRRDYVVEAKFLMANSYESMESLKNAYNIYYSILGKYPNTEVIQNRLKGIYSRRVARKR